MNKEIEKLDSQLEIFFNEAVSLCLKQIKSEITEDERMRAMKLLDEAAKLAVKQAFAAYRSELIGKGEKMKKERIDFSQKKYQPTFPGDTPVYTKEVLGDIFYQGYNQATQDYQDLIKEGE